MHGCSEGVGWQVQLAMFIASLEVQLLQIILGAMALHIDATGL